MALLRKGLASDTQSSSRPKRAEARYAWVSAREPVVARSKYVMVMQPDVPIRRASVPSCSCWIRQGDDVVIDATKPFGPPQISMQPAVA